MTTKADPIDFRRYTWGHGVSLKRTTETLKDGTPVFKGHCFYSGRHRIAEGTEFTQEMKSGRVAVFTIIRVTDHPMDPGDMYFIEACPTRYEDENA